MIEGAIIKMGDKEWTVPALSFKQVRVLLPKINSLSKLSAVMKPEQMAVVAEVVHAAVSRNYPDVSLADVEDVLDLRNAPKALMAVMGQSGLEASAEGEAQAGNL